MRHKLIIFFVLISFPLFAFQHEEDSTLFFGNTTLNYERVSNFLNGWYIAADESFVDSTTTYNGNKSLCLTSSTPSQLFAGYYIRLDDIDADSIAFEGKYKFGPYNKAGLYIAIQQIYNNPTNNFKRDTVYQKFVNNNSANVGNWQDFSIKDAIQPNEDGFFVVFATTSGSDTSS